MTNSFAIGKSNISTGGTTTDLTKSGFGDVGFAIVLLIRATSDATDTNDEILSFGVWDANDNQWSVQFGNEHNETIMNARKSAHDGRVVQVMSLTAGAAAIERYATASAITDGIRLTFDSTPGAAWIVLWAFFSGTSFKAQVGTIVSGDPSDSNSGEVLVGLSSNFSPATPEVVISSSLGNQTTWDGTIYGDATVTIGVTTFLDSVLKNLCASFERDDGAINQDISGYLTSASANLCLKHADAASRSYQDVRISDIDSDNVTYKSTTGSTLQRIGYAILSWQDTAHIHLEPWDSDWTAGAHTPTFNGFGFDFLFYFLSNFATRDTQTTGNLGAPFSLGLSDASLNSHMIDSWAQRAAGISNCAIRYDNEFVRQTTHTGTVSAEDAALDARTGTGFTYTPSVTAANAKAAWILCIADKPYEDASIAFSGVGTVTPAASKVASISSALSGAGTLTPDPGRLFNISSAFSGLGTLSPNVSRIRNIDSSFLGEGFFSAVFEAFVDISAAFLGSGTLSPNYERLVSISSAFAGIGTFSPSYQRLVSVDQSFLGSGSLILDPSRLRGFELEFSGAGLLSLSPSRYRGQTVSFLGRGFLEADAQGVQLPDTNFERIQRELVAQAIDGDFFRVQYNSDTKEVTVLETTDIPAFIAALEKTSNFDDTRRLRTEYRFERHEWLWNLILHFHNAVTVEIFENYLAAHPPRLAKTNTLQQVILEIQDPVYQHPPQHQSEQGTKVVIPFIARLSPV